MSGLEYTVPNYTIIAQGATIRVTDAGFRFGFSFDETQTGKAEEYGFVYSYKKIDNLNIKSGKNALPTTVLRTATILPRSISFLRISRKVLLTQGFMHEHT